MTNFLDFEQSLHLADGYLVTVNMQHIYECSSNMALRAAIFANPNARLCLDGRGAQQLFARHFDHALPLVNGNSLVRAWMRDAKSKRVLIVGSASPVISRIRVCFPDVDIVHDDGIFAVATPEVAAGAATALVAKYGADWDVIMLALGVPKQEILAQALAPLISCVPMLCIGGSFEIISEILPRSPAWVQRAGMEGVWRLALEPSMKRVTRMLRSYGSFVHLHLRPRCLAVRMEVG